MGRKMAAEIMVHPNVDYDNNWYKFDLVVGMI